MDEDPKGALRRRMRRMRAALTADALADAARAVVPHIVDELVARGAQTVCVYVSVRRELPTGPLVEALWARGLEVCVPRIVGETLEARGLRPGDRLVDGPFGVPTSDGPRVACPDVVLCPGLAFDRHGGRLGYGGGFYDRFLADRASAIPVGLCVDGALVEQVPRSPHDVLMHAIVTPSRRVPTG